MNFTNNAGLPAPLVSALLNDRYDYSAAGDISVTGLITPVRIRQLMKRHSKEITEDVSDHIWRLIGDIGHAIIERANADNVFREERLSTRLHGWLVTGKMDLMFNVANESYAIDDFKFRSVWAAKDLKPEDESQLNLYALLARMHSFDVRQLRIVSVLRDWSKLRAKREPDYPQAQVAIREIPLWSQQKQAMFLSERVDAHQAAEKLADDDLPLCTDEERWKKPDLWAVKKKGNKRALRLFESEQDAIAYIQKIVYLDADPLFNGKMEIEHRPGSYPRCESYCAVKEFCSFGRTLTPHSNDEEAA